MVCARVMGNDTVITIAGSNGHFELNVYKPVMIHAFLESAVLLGDACQAFNDFCAVGIKPHQSKIDEHLRNSLMLVTALNPHLGYDKAPKLPKKPLRKIPHSRRPPLHSTC
jgi:fumarate hydratase class II